MGPEHVRGNHGCLFFMPAAVAGPETAGLPVSMNPHTRHAP